jgi:GxxExxY protein
MTRTELDSLSGKIIGAAIEVHKELGPGLLENAYEACLHHELSLRGIHAERQVPLPVEYKGLLIECGYRLDLVVERKIVVELKAISEVLPVHRAQLLSYARLGKYPLGLLINFHELLLKDGVHRVINDRITLED